MLGLEPLFHLFKINESAIHLWVEKRLVEAVVLGQVQASQQGEESLFRSYHEEADALYDLSPGKRERAFELLHKEMFERLGYAEPWATLCAEFPQVAGKIGGIYVARASSPKEESVDLNSPSPNSPHPRGEGGEIRTVGVRLRVSRFSEGERLLRSMRHEWLKLADMLNPQFEYESRSLDGDLPPAQENLLRERYRVLWGASVDGRLERSGKEPLTPKEARRTEFDLFFRRLDSDIRERVYERLRNEDGITHPALLAMSGSLDSLRQFAGVGGHDRLNGEGEQTVGDESDGRDFHAPLDGSPCPLCGFPTFRWVLPSQENEAVLSWIHLRHSHWKPEYGICDRCYERYEELSVSDRL